jgi:FERM central domain/PTB domain (IRS-1 type)/RA like domain
LAVDPNITAQQLRDDVIERIELKEHRCFFIFEKVGDLERCLDHDDKPVEIMNSWDKSDSKKKEAAPKFLFKKKIFLKDDDKEMSDPVAKNLVYMQGVHDVVESVYMCQIPEAIKLAALQMQVTYQDHNPVIHCAGFLTKNASANIKSFVPRALWGAKKANEWESLILKEHAKLTGTSPETAKTEYLNIIKQWQLYGTTFFPPCRNIGNKNVPSKVIIGINYEGICLLKPKNKELISEHLFTEICSWASSSGTFAFEFGNQLESQKYTFDTRQGSTIASTIQCYIDILVMLLRSGDEESLSSSSLSSPAE